MGDHSNETLQSENPHDDLNARNNCLGVHHLLARLDKDQGFKVCFGKANDKVKFVNI
jgi:hypothetical protein